MSLAPDTPNTTEVLEPSKPFEDGQVLLAGVVVRATTDIHPHPSILQHGLAPAIAKISILADRGDLAFQEPLTITPDGIILDGFARWSLAKRKGRKELPCIVRPLDQSAALVYILQKQR
jgi:hypothetical protein